MPLLFRQYLYYLIKFFQPSHPSPLSSLYKLDSYCDYNTIIITTKSAGRDYSRHSITLAELVNDFEIGKRYLPDNIISVTSETAVPSLIDNESTASTSSTFSPIEIPESTIKETPSLQDLRHNWNPQTSRVSTEEVHHIYTYHSQKYTESVPVLSRLNITFSIPLIRRLSQPLLRQKPHLTTILQKPFPSTYGPYTAKSCLLLIYVWIMLVRLLLLT